MNSVQMMRNGFREIAVGWGNRRKK
jgi:hypothetical protein